MRTTPASFALPQRPAAVVFDMDGLLLDSERLGMAAFIETMAGHGHAVDLDFYQTLLGTPWPGIRERLIALYGPSLPADEIRNAWIACCAELCRNQLTLKAGVLELLDLLDTLSIPAAVATSSPKDMAMEHFLQMRLTHRFRHIVAQGDYERGKPDPAPYLMAAKLLGAAPEACPALEDSHNGVRSASSAGMMTLMVPDLVGPTDEILKLCVGVSLDLHDVREAIRATVGERATATP